METTRVTRGNRDLLRSGPSSILPSEEPALCRIGMVPFVFRKTNRKETTPGIMEIENCMERTMGRVFAVSVGSQKRTPKHTVDRAYAREDYGLEGDCHAGAGHRQVSLLAWEDVLSLRELEIKAKPGDFAENLTVEGMRLTEINVGARLSVGDALLEITEIGKRDWKEGDYSFQGIALVARSGLFARVIREGWIYTGDTVVVV